jgi:hypothetical protein
MRTISSPSPVARFAVLTHSLGGFTPSVRCRWTCICRRSRSLQPTSRESRRAVQLTLTADVIGLVVGSWCSVRCQTPAAPRLLIGSTLVCAIASGCARWRRRWAGSPCGASCRVRPGAVGIVLARAVAARRRERGGGGSAVLTLHDGVQRRADRSPGARRRLLAATGSWRPMFWLLAAISLVLAVATSRGDPRNAAS